VSDTIPGATEVVVIDAATRQIDEIVLLLGAADVAAQAVLR
jgi:hypothetical protein